MTPLHLVFLFGSLPAVAYADVLALKWMRGNVPMLDARLLRRLHYWIYLCLAGLISTGLIMLSERPGLLFSVAFYMKMAFVGALVINSVLIGKHMPIASRMNYAVLSGREKRVLLVSGAVSVIAWIGAIVGGLMIG